MLTQNFTAQLPVQRLRHWVENRPVGCEAAGSVATVLDQALGPPRVAVCTQTGVLTVEMPELPSVRIIRASWPVTQGGVDVVVLVHQGQLSTRIRARMAAGPMLFVQCDHVTEVPGIVATLVDAGPDGALGAARQRIVHGEMAGIAYRFPALAAELKSLFDYVPPPPVSSAVPKIAVIGPDPERNASVVDLVRADWQVAQRPDATVDAVIAVAPERGWKTQDSPTLIDAFTQVGRLVSTAALPLGMVRSVGMSVADAQHLKDAIAIAVSHPPAAPLPAVDAARWLQAAELADRRAMEKKRAEIVAIEQLANQRLAEAKARLITLGVTHLRPSWAALIDVLLVSIGVGGGLFRLALLAQWTAWPIAIACVGCGISCGAFRWRMHEVAIVRKKCVSVLSGSDANGELVSTSRGKRGLSVGGSWIRLKLASVEKQQKS